MYMCRYMFIWAACPTTIEMDLTFVLMVRFIWLNRDRSYYLVYVWPLPLLSVHKKPVNEPRLWMTWMCDGNRKPGPLEIVRDADFASSCRMEVWLVQTFYWTRTRASLATAPRNTSIATGPRERLLVCSNSWCNWVQSNSRNRLRWR